MDTTLPLERAIKAAGSAALLAKSLGVVKSAVSNWRRRKFVPAAKAMLIEEKFGVAARELCQRGGGDDPEKAKRPVVVAA